MADFGIPVAGHNPPPDGMTQLSNIMNLQRNQQALQSGALGIQRQQAELPAVQSQSGLTQDKIQQQQNFGKLFQSGKDDMGNSLMDANGEPDIPKVIAMQGRVAPLVPELSQGIITTHTAKVGLQSAAMSLSAAQRAALAGPIQAIATNPEDPNMVTQASTAIDQWAKEHPEMSPVAANAQALLSHVQTAQKPEDRARLANSLSALLQTGQQVQTQPQSATVNNGQQTLIGTVAPATAGGQFTPNTGVQQQIPPTATTVNPTTGQQQMYGPQGQGGPTTGVAPMDANALQQWGNHWTGVVQKAQQAPQNITLLTNARDNAQSAITGSGETAKNWINNVGSALGFAPSEQAKDSFDLYKKELSQYLASKGQGGTDLAQGIAGAGTPGQHMNTAALSKGFNELIAQEKMGLAQHDFFAQAGSDPKAYSQKFSDWSKINDYRAMQWNDMSAADKQTLVKGMKPQQKQNFRNALQTFQSMGYVQ
jgi:hypothetical protein